MTIALRDSKYRCPQCKGADFEVASTRWTCATCQRGYACVAGMPRLFLEERLGSHDRKLRDTFYDGLFGRFYQVMMPIIVMPVRPWSLAWPYWLAFAWVWTVGLALAVGAVVMLASGTIGGAVAALLGLALLIGFLVRNRYLGWLMLLAAPLKWVQSRKPHQPVESFNAVHARVLSELKARTGRLQVLDVSTGSCNSLYRHGWMELDADYTAIDLSETMLRQGSEMMAANGVAVDLVLGDAVDLPFQSEQFDVVLSYGAVNGLTDPATAIAEMARVAKPGGVLLFLDEQVYESANALERAYFSRVLSSHNVIHHCPVEAFPDSLTDVVVSQVYQFYYICTARKAG
jgi:ubiquinone/menaquinone biosynthesis C-methylase UbiE